LSLRRDTDWRARTVYLAAAQAPTGAPEANTYFLRTNADTATAARQIEAVVKRFDTALRSVDLITLENHVARSVLRERMLTILAVFFGAVALLLAAIGIYGVMAFQVARRRREIAIRIALGAEAARVVRMILTQVARLTILGCVIGAAGGLALTRVAKSVLYDVQPNDPATFVTAMTIVVAVGLAAAYLPGRWAARTNPVETLKVE
jgi:ABC-type antimicrobial peptide transport system permease subunit